MAMVVDIFTLQASNMPRQVRKVRAAARKVGAATRKAGRAKALHAKGMNKAAKAIATNDPRAAGQSDVLHHRATKKAKKAGKKMAGAKKKLKQAGY